LGDLATSTYRLPLGLQANVGLSLLSFGELCDGHVHQSRVCCIYAIRGDQSDETCHNSPVPALLHFGHASHSRQHASFRNKPSHRTYSSIPSFCSSPRLSQMADRLTQLQDAIDQMATIFYCALRYVGTHHDFIPTGNEAKATDDTREYQSNPYSMSHISPPRDPIQSIQSVT
jgi:hypothetical protein